MTAEDELNRDPSLSARGTGAVRGASTRLPLTPLPLGEGLGVRASRPRLREAHGPLAGY